MYYIQNAKVISSTSIDTQTVVIDKNKIVEMGSGVKIPSDATVIDAKGTYLSPGFIDIHVHGGGGYSAMSENPDDIIKMCQAHAKQGTTSILPTTLAAPTPALLCAMDSIRTAQSKCTDCNILGVHLEGPFLAPSQKGAQSESDLSKPTLETLNTLLNHWVDGVKMMGLAPELENALVVGQELNRRNIVASIAHSDATYEEVLSAIDAGFSDVTHLYSGCSMVKRENGYRIAGIVEAGLAEDALTVQVIADLRHLPSHLLKLIYKCKGADKISLITDGLEFAAGTLTEGLTYTQKNGVETVYEDEVMKLPDRQAFAGSVATSRKLVYNMYKHVGIPLVDVVRMATLTPAELIGIDKHKGRIAVGYDADIILFDDDINIKLCIVNGKIQENN